MAQVINRSEAAGEVTIEAFDDHGASYEPLTLSIGPGETAHFEFSRGEQGFVADFADYPPDDEEIYELTSGYRPLPSPLEPESALYLSGVNRSDDLVMFYKGQVAGLVAGAAYSVSVSVEIATDTPAGCVGVGGAPGESVWIKAGASEVEPLPVLRGSYLRMNIDIGNQSNGGGNAVVLGNMANSRSCEQPRQWERKSFQALSVPETVSASADGRAWLLFGTDSGFESCTEVYFTRATVTFAPLEPDGSRPASDPIPLRWLPPRKDRPDVH
ncbi:MAG: PEP-CTERM sorting domain-containing protein [Gammaproteobacteria bacterium]|nr:PEP-CTERM sorting domain-containing protein [Gammaproteobacteria bacterium]